MEHQEISGLAMSNGGLQRPCKRRCGGCASPLERDRHINLIMSPLPQHKRLLKYITMPSRPRNSEDDSEEEDMIPPLRVPAFARRRCFFFLVWFWGSCMALPLSAAEADFGYEWAKTHRLCPDNGCDFWLTRRRRILFAWLITTLPGGDFA